MAMKASMHSGRNGSAKHNDRTFISDKTPQEIREIAPHINQTMTSQNIINQVRQTSGMDLQAAELKLYTDLFTSALEATNRRYTAQGHKERCKTIEDLYKGRQTRPEETIYQIGNMEHTISPEKLHACYKDYMRRMMEWNQKHGCHMLILNYSMHIDETTPHIHERRVWAYQDSDGHRRIGQNRALKAAGVPLPHPDQPAGRYNNRKMTFDKMARQMWIEACRDHGIEIDDVPAQRVQHKDKQEYMASKIADLQHKLDKYEQLERNHPREFARMRQRDRGMTRFER